MEQSLNQNISTTSNDSMQLIWSRSSSPMHGKLEMKIHELDKFSTWLRISTKFRGKKIHISEQVYTSTNQGKTFRWWTCMGQKRLQNIGSETVANLGNRMASLPRFEQNEQMSLKATEKEGNTFLWWEKEFFIKETWNPQKKEGKYKNILVYERVNINKLKKHTQPPILFQTQLQNSTLLTKPQFPNFCIPYISEPRRYSLLRSPINPVRQFWVVLKVPIVPFQP